MRTKIALIAIVVAVSGCVHTGIDTPGSNGESGQGLVVQEFTIADRQLTTGQQSNVRVRLKNYHTEPVSINQLSLYNTGFMQAGSKSCSPAQIGKYREGFAPEMECTWTVTAPDDLGGFSSQSVTMQLNLDYSSAITNEQSPMKADFRTVSEIENRKEVRRKFSNGEVTVEVTYENPVPQDGGVVSFSLSPTGPGRVDSSYTMEYRPSSVFSDCPREVESVSEGKTTFSCEISSGSTSARNLVFSTSYKYVKSPSLDVEVVRP
ncbi:MAG: hypothetical protein ABEJ07_03790 [Candidatus Nanohaloarchaea archaeon]